MAINKKLIHFQTLANFEAQLSAGNILDTSICFIKDAKKIWTHGEFYNCDSNSQSASDFYIWEFEGNFADGQTGTISVEEYEKIKEAKSIILIYSSSGINYFLPSSSISNFTSGLVITFTTLKEGDVSILGTFENFKISILNSNRSYTIEKYTYDITDDTKVTSVKNHYTPTATDILQASGGDLTDISNSGEGIQVITGLHRDAAGHITDVSSVALTSTTVFPHVPITYSNLVTLRNNRELVPGCWYRIVDYTTVDKNAELIGSHDFDILVLATGVNTLSEEARARKKDGDIYFANSNLDAWKIWYCLDNDENRFDWADSENGKGVIYRMIDEYNNDCPFDFKNIAMSDGDISLRYKTVFSYENEDSQYSDLTIVDRTDDEGTVVKPRNNYIAPLIVNGKMSIPNISFEYSYGYDYGIVYECQNNKIGPNCNYIIFKDTCSNNTIGSNCNQIEFSTDCIGNIIGDNCNDITILEYSGYNTIGPNCASIGFLSECGYNTIGSYSNDITIGELSKYNTIGSECNVITIEDNCRDCVVSTMGSSITIEYDSSSIEFGANCSDITIGHSNRNIKFGKECSNVLFVEGRSVDSYIGNITGMFNITVGNNVQNTYFFQTDNYSVCNTEIASDIVDEEVELPYNLGNWKIAKNSNGEVKVYCEADLIL